MMDRYWQRSAKELAMRHAQTSKTCERSLMDAALTACTKRFNLTADEQARWVTIYRNEFAAEVQEV